MAALDALLNGPLDQVALLQVTAQLDVLARTAKEAE